MRRTIALIAGLSLGLCAIATRTESMDLLVRLEERSLREGGIIRTEIFVYRDGSVMTRQEFPFTPPMIRILRQAASETQMLNLGRTFLNNQIGLQRGECFLDSGNAEEARLQTQVDWFGRAPRRRSFITDTSFAVECGPQAYAIVTAISNIFSQATVIDEKTFDDLIEEIE
jgi:hypothetical protein